MFVFVPVGFVRPGAGITAIDFNGDLLGKVIPDGKVVGFDNQLIGNVTADSLIINFEANLSAASFLRALPLETMPNFWGR